MGEAEEGAVVYFFDLLVFMVLVGEEYGMVMGQWSFRVALG